MHKRETDLLSSGRAPPHGCHAHRLFLRLSGRFPATVGVLKTPFIAQPAWRAASAFAHDDGEDVSRKRSPWAPIDCCGY